MAPLSVLPGRLRFEITCLIGNKDGCFHLEEGILSLNGVLEASASFRTGRVLVRFDESLVTRSEVERELTVALQAVARQKERAPGSTQAKRAVSSSSPSGVGHFMMEMALHAFLPAPLDLLLPAATALRK